MSSKPLIRLPLMLLAPMLLAACLGQPTPETYFYVLNATAPKAGGPAAETPLTLQLSELSLPDYLARGQVVSRATANRLQLSEFRQWGGNLRKDIGRVLSTNLSRLLNTPNVLEPPIDHRQSIDVRLRIDILAFEYGPDEQVRLQARWMVRDARDGSLLASELSELARPAPGPRDMDALVAAMSTLLGELSGQIADGVKGSR